MAVFTFGRESIGEKNGSTMLVYSNQTWIPYHCLASKDIIAISRTDTELTPDLNISPGILKEPASIAKDDGQNEDTDNQSP